MARDILISLDRERNYRLIERLVIREIRGGGRQTYDPAESEEGTTLEHASGHVAAVVALADDALVAREFLADGLLAADEEEEHDGRVMTRRVAIRMLSR